MSEDIMTRDEIQRFIDLSIRKGKTELEIFRELREILGLKFDTIAL